MSAQATDLPAEQASEMLADVIERNYPNALELKSGSVWVQYRSRFLGLQDNGERRRIWIELPQRHDEDGGRTPVRLQPSQRFICSFTCDHERYRFVSGVIRAGEFRLAGGGRTAGLIIAWPPAVQRVQRRSHYRHEIPASRPVEAKLWDGGPEFAHQAIEGHRPLYLARMIDISVGGARLQIADKTDPRWDPGDVVGLEFTLEQGGPLLLVEGIVRRVGRSANRRVEVGLEFSGLELTSAGRRALDYLSHTLARIERRSIRRKRVGLD